MSYKTCTKCNESKLISQFPKKKESKDGLHSWCKVCKYTDRLRYKRAKDSKRHAREYYYRNKDRWVFIKANRRARLLKAAPVWLDSEYLWLINEVYELSALRNKLTSIKWEVDHIVPLAGKNVCGLHVPWNLQVITRVENRKKSNIL